MNEADLHGFGEIKVVMAIKSHPDDLKSRPDEIIN